ncbi:TLD-domain containing nucleolar protein [Wolffia australiana]
MGNSLSPPADPQFASAARAFTKQELEDLRALFTSLAAQSQNDARFISSSVFEAYYGLKGDVGKRMFDLVTHNRRDGMLFFEDMVIAKAVYEKGTRQETDDFIFQLCDVSGDGRLTRSDLEAVLKSIQDMIFSPKNTRFGLRQHQNFVTTYLSAASFSERRVDSDEHMMSASDFKAWCNAVPSVKKFLSSLLAPSIKGKVEEQVPWLQYPKALKSDNLLMTSEYAWLVGGLLPTDELKEWRLLYHSSLHGQSFNTFLGNVVDAECPTILVIKDKEGCIYGGYASQPWEKHSSFYGDMKCFLFQLVPRAAVFRPTGTNTNLQWCAVGYSSEAIPNGVGFGGRVDHFGLFLSSSFDQGYSFACSTFDSPSLSKSASFQPKVIECWATTRPAGSAATSAVNGTILERFKEDRNMLKLVGLAGSSD